MTVSPFALLAASALVGAGTTIAGTPAFAPPGSRYDAACAVFAAGDQPLVASPSRSNTSRSSTSIRIRADTGDARSADGGLAAATSQAYGGTVGRMQGEPCGASDVRSKNLDGSPTAIGLQNRLHIGHGTVITIASATCTPAANGNSRSRLAPVDHTNLIGAGAGYAAWVRPAHAAAAQTDNALVSK